MNSEGTGPRGLTTTQWLICIIAAIGFAFDIYELLMLPLIVGPALSELVGAAPGSELFNTWVGRLFYIPAFAGGVFGLLGGYLTDLFGRRRVLTYSILLYAVSAFLAGFSTSIWMLLVLRCTTFVGVCVEFVAAVAWLAELFTDPRQREKVIGYTQAFSSIGGLLIAVANSVCIAYAARWPAIGLPDWLNIFGGTVKDPHAPWRYTLMSGLIPALPLVIIRPFLPESPAWQKKRVGGTLKRPSLGELFTPELRRTTIVTTIMFALAYGAAFGAIQHIPRIVPGLPQVKAETAGKPVPEQKKIQQAVAAKVTKVQELGGLYGRSIMAVLAVALLAGGQVSLRSLWMWGMVVAFLVQEAVAEFSGGVGAHFGRAGVAVVIGGATGVLVWSAARALQRILRPGPRSLIRVFQVPGLIIMPLVFAVAAVRDLNLLYVGIFLAGMLTVGQFNFWGNYLPSVYPVHLRGTGESFAANIGGRMIGTSFAWLTTTLAVTADKTAATTKLAMVAAAVGFAVYLGGFIASFWLPERKQPSMND